MKERFGLPLALVLIDTLSPAAQFKDANDSSEAQRVMSVLKAVALEFDTLVLAVDHMGKDTSTGTRNSSVKEADVDATLALLGDRDLAGNVNNARMGIRKVRGAATGAEIKFTKRVVVVPSDLPEDPTTLVIDWADPTEAEARPVKAPKPAWGGKSRLLKSAMDVVMDRAKEMRPFGMEGPEVKAVDRERVRAEFFSAYPADTDANQDTKRRTFNRLMDEALAKRLIAARAISGVDWLWYVQMTKAKQAKRDTKRDKDGVLLVPLSRARPG